MIMSWNVTNRCNLYCDHCYRNAGVEDNNELTTEEGKALLDEIAKSGFKIMIFSGGEPLMRKDIYELISYAAKIGLRPVLGSNGMFITKEVAEKLVESGLKAVGISLDSLNKNKHDKFRKLDGAWRDTLYGMKNCRDAGLAFQIHNTIMNWNRNEAIDIIDFSVAIGAAAYYPFFLVPTGRGESIEKEILEASEYEELLTSIMKKKQQIDIEIKPTCAPQFLRIANSLGLKLRFSRGCLAGINYCIISPKGDVQPCAYLKEVAGNVRETPFSEIWRDSKVFNELRTEDYKGVCGECKHKKICGGCRARAAYYNEGNYMSEDSSCVYANCNGC